MQPMHAIVCQACSFRGNVPQSFLGRKVTCPSCSQVLQLPPPPKSAVQQRTVPKRAVQRASTWYILKDGKALGPVSVQAVQQLAERGKVTPQTWVMQHGSDLWILAEKVPGFNFFHKPAPRPLAPPVPQRPAAAPMQRAAAPVAVAPRPPALETMVTACPTCHAACRIAKPLGAMSMHACPHCRQPFRAALTSVGVTVQRVHSSTMTTVHRAGSPTTALQ